MRAVISFSAATISTRCGPLSTSTRPSSPDPGIARATRRTRPACGPRQTTDVVSWTRRALCFDLRSCGVWGAMSAFRAARRRAVPAGEPDRQWRDGPGLARPRRGAAPRRRGQGGRAPDGPRPRPSATSCCQRTLREARAAGRLSHPNVVAVYDVVQAEGRPWIVMELVRSRSLYQVIREDGPVPPRRAAEIGLAVLAALRAAHAAGVLAPRCQAGQRAAGRRRPGGADRLRPGHLRRRRHGHPVRADPRLGPVHLARSGPATARPARSRTCGRSARPCTPRSRAGPRTPGTTSMATLTALATQPPDPPPPGRPAAGRC